MALYFHKCICGHEFLSTYLGDQDCDKCGRIISKTCAQDYPIKAPEEIKITVTLDLLAYYSAISDSLSPLQVNAILDKFDSRKLNIIRKFLERKLKIIQEYNER